ncbi:hypothetical protein CUMW_251010, partial [Citrus unshiu]
MGKSKLALHNPPGPINEPGMMKILYVDHFPGRITSMCKLDVVVNAIQEKLTRQQLQLFKNNIFGRFLQCQSYPFSGVIVHNILLRQVSHGDGNDKDELWFQVGDHLIRLSIGEWCLVTGLCCGEKVFLTKHKTKHRLLNKYFGGMNCDINLGQFEEIFMNLHFKTMNDTDALKIAMFYFADRVLHGRKDHCQINFNLLNEVDDINHFRSIPWGRLSWETIYKSIDNVLNGKAKKFKKASAENPLHRIEKYNFYGFTSAVHAWIFEAIEGLPLEWVEKIRRNGPRIVRWKPVAFSDINFGEVYSYLNERLDGTILQTLKPDAKERATNYWKSVDDYVPYLPSWVRNHQPSINAPSSIGPNKVDPNPTSEIRLEQSPVEDVGAADDHYESAHDSDDRNEPKARTKFRNDYFVGRLDKIETSIHELRSELQTGHSSINELRSEIMAERREAQQYRAAVMGFMASFGAGASKGAYGDSPFGPSHMAPDGYGPNVDAGYGTHTDAGNDDEHTSMSLYSVYGDISDDSVQIFTEAPPGVSKLGCPYRPSYIFGSPYFIPPFKRVR